MGVRPDIAIVAAWIGPRPPEVSAVERNHRSFSLKHGYSYNIYDERSLKELHTKVGSVADAHWIKPEVIRLSLENHDYVFWTDLDSVFHQKSKSLQDLVELNKDFVFTGDHNDLCNGGHLFFRRSEWTFNFLKDWHSLRFLVFPGLHTSMQGDTGHVGDQVALNYLLGGGLPNPGAVTRTAANIFNSTNGWVGNPDRKVINFGARYGPTRSRNLAKSRNLVSRELRPHVGVVVQHRLNAYPWWTPDSTSLQKGPIIHFVSPYKSELMPYLEGKRPSPFGSVRARICRAISTLRALAGR